MQDKVKQTTDFLASRLTVRPYIGMIAGTGLGSVTGMISAHERIPYKKIPHFPESTTQGHKGSVLTGELAGKPVMAFEGRFHHYEGYSPQEITFPVRVMAQIGVRYLFISSASGGLNPRFETGDLMVITDHINLTGTNPLIGPNLDSFGPRFPDMSRVYSPDLISIARQKALELRTHLRQGVYVGVLGPSMETPAETRFLKLIGADAVGMSTVSEAIVGAHCGLQILAIVVITNVNLPDCMKETSLEDVIRIAESNGHSLAALWEKIAEELPPPQV